MSVSRPGVPAAPRIRVHPLLVRLTHWINAYAMVCMISSGWGIYNASPVFKFLVFPRWLTLGGWLGGSIAWHLAAMWLLVGNGLVYLLYGAASGHLRRDLLRLRLSEILHDAWAAITFRLPHRIGHYNAVQRLLYVVVLLCGALAVASGLSIWKPVQLAPLTNLFGGFDFARKVHFVAMAGIVGFVVIHLVLVLIVPSTLWPMVSGTAKRPAASPEGEQ